jgi:four helix bundle protein
VQCAEGKVGSMKFLYENLEVTDELHLLIKDVYLLTAQFPAEEKFGLVSQIRRAATSVLLNLAEGSSRKSRGDYARSIQIALGSLVEVDAGMKIAQTLSYVKAGSWEANDARMKKVYFSLVALRNAISSLR